MSFEKYFTISVTNVNESPTDIGLSSSTVFENSALGTSVGDFSTVDPDLGDQFAYQLVSGAGDTDNGKFSIVGNQLRVNSAIDYETQNTFSVRVRSTDLGGLAIDEVFSLSALDVNESVVLTVTNSIVTGDVLTLLNNTGTWVDPENVNAAVTLSGHWERWLRMPTARGAGVSLRRSVMSISWLRSRPMMESMSVTRRLR